MFSVFLGLFQPILALNEATTVFFKFFSYFFGILYYVSDWNGTKRQFLFSLFLGVSPLILAWNEAIIVFYNFLKFFAIFLEFSITRRVGTKRNDNFCFPSFSAFFNVFWLEMKPQWYFFKFFKIFPIFWNFLLRVRLEWNMTIVFTFSFSQRSPPLFWL